MSLINDDQSSALGKAFDAFVPASLKQTIRTYAKAVVAATGSALALVNALAPAYSDEAQAVIGVILAVATILGVRQVPNA